MHLKAKFKGQKSIFTYTYLHCVNVIIIVNMHIFVLKSEIPLKLSYTLVDICPYCFSAAELDVF